MTGQPVTEPPAQYAVTTATSALLSKRELVALLDANLQLSAVIRSVAPRAYQIEITQQTDQAQLSFWVRATNGTAKPRVFRQIETAIAFLSDSGIHQLSIDAASIRDQLAASIAA